VHEKVMMVTMTDCDYQFIFYHSFAATLLTAISFSFYMWHWCSSWYGTST